MARIHFILDPVHPRLGREWPYEQKKIETLTHDFEVHIVRGRQHAEQLSKAALKKGAELIVCVGSDSSLNEIVNALYPFDHHQTKLSVHSVYQVGSMTKSFPFKPDFLEFIRDFLDQKTEVQNLDLAEIRFTGNFGQKIKRVFVDSASFGFASAVVSRLSLKDQRGFGQTDFLKLLFRKLPFYREPSLRIKIDDQKEEINTLLTAFMNNMAFTARGLKVSPHSSPQDGVLEFTRIRKARFHQYLSAALPFYAGRKTSFSFIDTIPFKIIKLEALSGRSIRLDFDGEFRGFLPAEIQVREKALRILK